MAAALLACFASSAFADIAPSNADALKQSNTHQQVASQRHAAQPTIVGASTQTPTTTAATPTPDPSPEVADTRQKRQQAYARLLEGQRYLAGARTGVLPPSALRIAQQSFQQAATLDPTLSEAHTALAEIAFLLQDIEQAEKSAAAAARANPDNFGARRILSRIYTVKSNLFGDNLDRAHADKAIKELREVVRLDTNDAEAWALLGDFYQATGRDREAIEAYGRWSGAPAPVDGRFYANISGGRELAPDTAFARLAETLLRLGRTSEAIQAVRRAIALEPNNAGYLELLSRTVENGGSASEQESVLAELRRLVEADPSKAVTIGLLARAQARAGRVDEAVKSLRDAIANRTGANADRESFALRTELAQLLSDALRYDEAVAVYEEMLKERRVGDAPLASDTERSFASSILMRIITLRRRAGQGTQALAAIERMRRLLGTDDEVADLQLILLLREQGKRPEALEAARRARQRHPQSAEFVRLEATALADLGRVDEGAALLRARLKGVPDDYDEYISIANLYLEAGRGREAVEAAQKAVELAPPDEQRLVTQALLMLSSARERAGDAKGSEEALRRILAKEPNNATALNNLGYFLVERNERLPEALEMIQRAVRAEPANASFLDSLGWAYFKLGQLDEAERYLNDAARRNPSSVAIQEHLGDLYQRRGKTDQARIAWRKALALAVEAADTSRIKGKIDGGNTK